MDVFRRVVDGGVGGDKVIIKVYSEIIIYSRLMFGINYLVL